MIAEAFLDTNVLLYACSASPADAEKQRRAEDLIVNAPFALSAQVLQEFIANALKKRALGISEAGIDAVLELAGQVPVLPVTHELIVAAVVLRRRFRFSHWDATIVAAAQELQCRILYSEDLSHGQDYDGVRVVNPFL
ncbi:MAG: PIN domain-containing protein [Akkermansiaceae bacterium]|nr:PIN domain-containing protein [Akkermansiaceae bacterium]